MISPYNIICKWSNPNSLWKDCEVIIEVNNSDTKNDLILKGDTLLAKFLKDVQNFTVYTTYDYTLYNDTILNRTCFDSLNATPEERERILENKSLCFYNITRKNFYNFQPTTKLDKIYKNSVIGIKLVFKSPIVADAGVYLKNHFNFTLLSDYNLTLDPDISACSVLDTDYGVYTLTADISNSANTYCMNISANHVIFDCQGHTIDGTDASSSYGIYVYRSFATTTNETIKNCVLTDWGDGIYLSYSNSNTLSNITSSSNSYYGIYLYRSNSNTLSNITSSSNSYGIYLYYSNSNTLSNITSSSNSNGIYLDRSNSNTLSNITSSSNSYGIYLYSSGSNTIKNSIIQGNSQYGIYLDSAGSTPNSIYNNLFNNTKNFYFGGTIYTNNWNTTRQTGTRIYSPGTEIGGNYWTNSTGNGYSDTCADADTDGFCDNAYTLTTNNLDYLPLSDEYSAADTTPPTYSLNSTNSTIAGTAVSHNLYWQDNVGLSGYIFSFDNCTGTLVNDTWVSITGTGNWSNVTKVINSTIGCTIRWCVYANDTSNNWNGTSCLQPFSYITTSAAQAFYKTASDYLSISESELELLMAKRLASDYMALQESGLKQRNVFKILLDYFGLSEASTRATGVAAAAYYRAISDFFSLFEKTSLGRECEVGYHTEAQCLAANCYWCRDRCQSIGCGWVAGPYPGIFYGIEIFPENLTIFKPFGEQLNQTIRYELTNIGNSYAEVQLIPDSDYLNQSELIGIGVNKTAVLLMNLSLPAELPKQNFLITVKAVVYQQEVKEAYIYVKIVEVPSWLVVFFDSIGNSDLVSAMKSNELNKATNIYISKLTRQYYGIPFIVYVMTPTLAFLYYVTKKRETRVRGQKLGWKFSLAVIILVLLIAPVLPLP
jgi:parallel beta-helix repeat protein